MSRVEPLRSIYYCRQFRIIHSKYNIPDTNGTNGSFKTRRLIGNGLYTPLYMKLYENSSTKTAAEETVLPTFYPNRTIRKWPPHNSLELERPARPASSSYNSLVYGRFIYNERKNDKRARITIYE